MRFLHLGDLHLANPWEFDLSGDQKYILDQMLAVIRGKDGRCGTDRRGCV